MIVQAMMLEALGAEELFRLMRIPPFAAKGARRPARRSDRFVPATAGR
jgi:hypothetical protein